MKAFSTQVLVMIIGVTLSNSLFAQNNLFTKDKAKLLTNNHASTLELTEQDITEAIVSDAYINTYANTQMVYLQQAYKGVPVYNAIKSIAFKNDKVVSVAGNFFGKPAVITNTFDAQPVITPANAVAAAAINVNRPVAQSIAPIHFDGKLSYDFPDYGISQEQMTAKLLWVPSAKGKLLLSWQVSIVPVKSDDYWLINVDATTGEIISKHNLTVYEQPHHIQNEIDGHYNNKQAGNAAEFNQYSTTTNITSGTYRVIPFPAESPNHAGGTPVVVTNPWDSAGPGNAATVFGWHNDSVTDYTYTRGNNVWAREDTSATNGAPTPGRAAFSTTPSPVLTFDFPFNDQQSPLTVTNQNFAITQLFYWNNIMHDVTYQYGFDEVSGNFQRSNNGKGGLGNDYVIADAQDGSGTNNANFRTPADGSRPRMQMYLFGSSSDKLVKVNAPGDIAGFKQARESGLSTNNKLDKKGPITGDVVLYSTVPTANNGCSTLAGTPLSGKIALIDRGTCPFVDKLKNAQLAGASAVIVANNVNGTPIVMGGTDNTIVIPGVMINLNDANIIKQYMQSGSVVNVTLSGIALDGDLDNGIVAHEYAHGISIRLTGGPANSSCLINAEQMGEGWSDYFALMLNTNWRTATVNDGPIPRGIGTYAAGQAPTGGGIRNFPYSTDLAVNPWTYGMLSTNTGGEVHNTGEIWAATIWDMTWNLIALKGINPDMYAANVEAGNSIALKLVTEGMKLQPCLPGFLDGRDGILKADTLLYGGRYSCAIWNAFARRGMGINAIQGSSESYTDQVEDFTPAGGAAVTKKVDKMIADQNDELNYTITTTCKCEPVANYTVVDTLPANVTYLSGGTYNSSSRVVTINVPPLNPGQSFTENVKVRINTGTYTAPVNLINETVPGATLPAIFTSSASGVGSNWATTNTRSHSNPFSIKATNANGTSRQVLTTNSSYLINGISTLSFWHYFNTETGYDGGVVEISENNGTTWFDAAPFIYKNGYTGPISSDRNRGFTGNSGQFIETLVNLTPFNNKQVKIRFVFTSDDTLAVDGWYIDDIVLKNQAGVYNVAQLYNAFNVLEHVSDTATLITQNLPLVWGRFTAEKENTVALLKWTTLQEQNTKEFAVERSIDGQVFTLLNTVKASGNASSARNYTSTDINPVNGLNYYRIKQIDADGKFSFSAIRTLLFEKEKGSVTIAPNPAKDKITITVAGNTKTLQVAITNQKGQRVGNYILTGETTRLTLPRYSAGMYYVTITGEQFSAVRKLVIE